jgi:1-acyl-sn-glycerol-3-phosphate acyltransferase
LGHHLDKTIGLIRGFFRVLGSTFIEKDAVDIKNININVEIFKSRDPLLIYPEESYHTFRDRYTVFRFSHHVIYYAAKLNRKIVPVAMIGVEEATPCFGGLKKPGMPLHISPLPIILPFKIIAEFGEPVSVETLLSSAPATLEEKDRYQYAADRLQEIILKLIKIHRLNKAKLSDVNYIQKSSYY